MSRDNKRKTTRLHHEIPVAYRSVGSFLTDWATNISRGGLFINTRKPLPVGTAVRILVQIPGAQLPVELDGRVTRTVEFDNRANLIPGMGVEFTGVDHEKQRELETLIKRLRRDLEEA